MRREGEGGKKHEAPTHLIKISEFTYAARVTKNMQNHKVSSQEKSMVVFVAHNPHPRRDKDEY
jgi:hypothetical protein